MIKTLLSSLIALALVGCGSIRPDLREINTGDEPTVVKTAHDPYKELPNPAGPPVVVAVYNFKDLTGQRKPSLTLSLFSTAVTQGAEAYLIKALSDAGNRQWFTVVERVGLDNLLKERQMVKQTREIYEGDKAKPLPPMRSEEHTSELQSH